MKTIEIIIDAAGQVRLQTKGFAGAACKAASAEIEKALGLVESDQPTAEQYQSSTSTTAQQQTTGS